MCLGPWLGLLALGVSVYILWQIRQILLLVFLAVILATAVNRVVRQLQELGIKRGIAIALSLGFFLLLLVSFIGIILPPLTAQFRELIERVPEVLERLQAWSSWLQARMPSQMLDERRIFDRLTQRFQVVVSWLISNFYNLLFYTLDIILSTLLVIVLTIMLLASPQPYRKGFVRLFPAFYRRRVDAILSECEVSIIGWLTGVALAMSFIAMTSGIGLWILQIPLPLVNAILAGLLAIIPYIGAILSVLPPMALALLVAPWKALAVLVLYVLIQQVEGNFVTPLVMQQQVSLLPALTLAIMTAFGLFFGLLGLFLALPIVVVAQVWFKNVVTEDVLDRWQQGAKNH